jgi:enterobactin synthetase component D
LDPLVPEALRLAVRKRQIAYVGGRLCAEQALCALGAGITEVGRSKHGAPIWPAGTIGSIAHTGSHAYAAAASSHRQLGVGIDSEFVVPHMFEAIAGVCCTSRERTRWLNEHREPVLATLIFSAKESFYKAIEARVRRFVDFQEVEVVSHDAVRQQLSLEVDSSDLRQLVRSAPVQYRVDGTTVHTTVLLVD